MCLGIVKGLGRRVWQVLFRCEGTELGTFLTGGISIVDLGHSEMIYSTAREY